MRDVEHFVSIAQADNVGEVVLNDSEMIAVVVDVSREQQRVAPTDDALLASIRRAPIDFQHDLITLHEGWRLEESIAELGEEGQ